MSATATAQSNVTSERVFNFSAGPAVLPVSVLEQLRDEMMCYPGAGASIMELSHRGKVFVEIMEQAQSSLRSLLNVPDTHEVLFLQGGSALQFSMIPCNLLRGSNKTAEYLVTGSWGKKAIAEGRKEGDVTATFDGSTTNYDRVPKAGDYQTSSDAAYLYYCSNETIQGVQFQSEPEAPAGVPLICDASSDFLSRPLDISKYGLIYACAQKNAGPAGVTAVIMRKDLIDKGDAGLPGYLNYQNHYEADSMWNTPPTFAIYVLGKITRWLLDDIGGLEAMKALNEEKSSMVYDVIDANPNFYKGHAQVDCRSKMNVTFNLPSDELLSKFIKEAGEHKLASLAGHRSVGGIRASLYNAMPREGAQALAQFMSDFAAKNG
ncbi:3-phosphoserine/phosphohydroxythreonine transaminase [Rubripirellula amarantea]|uniref:Phosphoserine aminotransferase n=1 Tax=Rubripirellula amarantea TaxID=2527999 RepID=A0A5C5WSL1_9BACT|nr:3-phosphoserine/phosphohydroxythreonine transaminase [Rubripirellula amarantea]MDA8745621.1 3-phosphoserine/phosphohydroxythreonine transaminase [Rubripirellula amarantea]TWT53135.1 Phosphoserine aminotransferase [Rubripirellula amarantea]